MRSRSTTFEPEQRQFDNKTLGTRSRPVESRKLTDKLKARRTMSKMQERSCGIGQRGDFDNYWSKGTRAA